MRRFLAIALTGFLLGSGSAVGAAAGQETTAAQARHEAGRKIYNFRCYFCHGYSGDAKTLASTYLNPRPRAFVADAVGSVPRAAMIAAVRDGKEGTAMKGFAGILSNTDIELVVDFVREEFMRRKAPNTRYHTAAAGWPNHERNRIAFPFADGTIPLDRPWAELTPEQQRGKRLFLQSCVSCHDHGRTEDAGPVWEGRPLSYPRNQYQPGQHEPPTMIDAMTSASPYMLHDVVPQIAGLTKLEKRGEDLYQKNCAFCHAADGTGKNWIGSFMEPHPRDLTNPAFMAAMTRSRLTHTIREGLPNTSMPAWKSVLAADEIEAIVAYVSKAFHPIKPE